MTCENWQDYKLRYAQKCCRSMPEGRWRNFGMMPSIAACISACALCSIPRFMIRHISRRMFLRRSSQTPPDVSQHTCTGFHADFGRRTSYIAASAVIPGFTPAATLTYDEPFATRFLLQVLSVSSARERLARFIARRASVYDA